MQDVVIFKLKKILDVNDPRDVKLAERYGYRKDQLEYGNISQYISVDEDEKYNRLKRVYYSNKQTIEIPKDRIRF